MHGSLWRRWLLVLAAAGLGGIVVAQSAGSVTAHQVRARAKTFTNPVYPHNFADPFILHVGKTFYAYATGTCDDNLQVIHSTDLVSWTGHTDPMPKAPRWTQTACNGFFQNRMMWAPEVLHRSDGKYVLYYAASWPKVNHQCIGHAVASKPEGPFVDSSSKPFLCQTTQGGSIDPDVFKDSTGQLYLYWKNDGNCCSLPVWIWGQKLSSDGMKLLGKPAKMETVGVNKNDYWEGTLIEAPTMLKHGGKYYLFFSANGFNTKAYATGYAVCKGPMTGVCTTAKQNPVLKSKCNAAGPGHQAIFTDDSGQTWIVYHAWKPTDIGDRAGGPGRQLWMDRLNWKGGKAVVHGPTCTAQPAPKVKG